MRCDIAERAGGRGHIWRTARPGRVWADSFVIALGAYLVLLGTLSRVETLDVMRSECTVSFAEALELGAFCGEIGGRRTRVYTE